MVTMPSLSLGEYSPLPIRTTLILFNSVLDPRDHPYVLGVTNNVESFIEALHSGEKAGKEYLATKAEWKASAGLMTFDEAVKNVATEEQYSSYMESVAEKIVPLQQRRNLALGITGKTITFDWELPRTPHGQYMWQWCTKAVIDRCVLAAPLGDVTWSRQG